MEHTKTSNILYLGLSIKLSGLINSGWSTNRFFKLWSVPFDDYKACIKPYVDYRLALLYARLGRLPEAERHLAAVEQAWDRPDPPMLFVNTHPVELERPGLVESLEELRAAAPNVDLVLEIHESALAQSDFITWLSNRLLEINVGLVYDDFGAGQARLFELAEAPPHYLKFDRRFVTKLETAPVSRQRLVASLVAAARELLVKTLAEGVENKEEAEACLRAGFSLAQGYHFGRPTPIENLGKERSVHEETVGSDGRDERGGRRPHRLDARRRAAHPRRLARGDGLARQGWTLCLHVPAR